MSQAEELLNSLSEGNVATYSVTKPHIIIDQDRIVTVPEALKDIAVQFDHNIATVTFDCPRYWYGHDISLMRLYVNYKTPSGVIARCPVKNIIVDASDSSIIHFDWTISKNVTLVMGKISFLACAYRVDDTGNEQNHWNSRLNKEMEILEGLEADHDEIVENYPDELENILARLNVLEALGGIDNGVVIPNDAMSAAIYDPQGRKTDVFKYVDDKIVEGGSTSGGTSQGSAVTDIAIARVDDTVTITYTMANGDTIVDTLTLDANGCPVNLNVNGVDIPITCIGLAEEEVNIE